MNRGLRRQLRKKYEQEVDEAARRLLADGDATEVASAINTIESHSKLLAAAKPKHEKVWAISAAMLCLLIAGLLWAIHISDSKLLLNIRSTDVRLRLTKSWSQQNNFKENKLAPSSEIQIENSSEIKVSGKPCGSSLTLDGNMVQLTKLSFRANSEINLAAVHDYLNIYARDSGVEGEVTYSGSPDFSGEAGPCVDKSAPQPVKVPEAVSFSSNGQGATPMALKIRSPIQWSFQNLEIDSVDFSHEQPPGSGAFEPTIQKGSVTLHDVPTVVELREGDRLKLEGIKGKCMRIWVEDGLNILCDLTANTVLLGPQGAERNLAPTWLEYLYHKKPLGFLWSTVAFLWGVLWGARQFFQR